MGNTDGCLVSVVGAIEGRSDPLFIEAINTLQKTHSQLEAKHTYYKIIDGYTYIYPKKNAILEVENGTA